MNQTIHKTNSDPAIDYAVFVGRFQPFHIAHLDVCKKASELAKHLIILVGSAFSSPSIRNPFSFEQRRSLINQCLDDAGIKSITILPVPDYYYSDDAWVAQIQLLVYSVATPNRAIAIVGFKKDHSSSYLNWFPQWQLIEFPPLAGVHATTIRCHWLEQSLLEIKDSIPQASFTFLKDLYTTEQFQTLKEEYELIKAYKTAWNAAPYPPTFVTTDAIVTCCGHILLVTRKSAPGKGLLALPGGFIDPNENLEISCLRKLKEETRIKVPLAVLKGSIVDNKVFDHPLRSVRGRTITHGYYIKLEDIELPKVRGGGDTTHAYWMPLSEVRNQPERFFEDHQQIIESFIGRG